MRLPALPLLGKFASHLNLRPPMPVVALGIASLLLVWAWHLKHPLMYALRPVETPFIAVASLAGLWWSQRRLHARWLGRACAVAFAIALGLALWQEGLFHWQRYRLLHGTPVLRTIGSHFIIGYRSVEEVAPLAEQGLIGGIYLTRRNVAGRTLAEVRAEIDYLQSLRQAHGLPPLFVAADQEGGAVNHLSPLLQARPPLGSLAGLAPEARSKAAYRYGQQQGAELGALGVNLNLSPVVDLRPKKTMLVDTHTLLQRRAISSNSDTVSQIASAYSAGLRAAGIQPTLKHFPGLARVDADTHLQTASLSLDRTRLLKEASPFERIPRDTGAAIMVAHVHVPAIDPKVPASLSRPVIQELLREQWHFDGLVLTDDLNMGAVYGRGIGQAAIASLNAGADLILVTYDPDQYIRAMSVAVDRYRRGGISEIALYQSRMRIARHWQQAA